jgi:hypothetical protein
MVCGVPWKKGAAKFKFGGCPYRDGPHASDANKSRASRPPVKYATLACPPHFDGSPCAAALSLLSEESNPTARRIRPLPFHTQLPAPHVIVILTRPVRIIPLYLHSLSPSFHAPESCFPTYRPTCSLVFFPFDDSLRLAGLRYSCVTKVPHAFSSIRGIPPHPLDTCSPQIRIGCSLRISLPRNSTWSFRGPVAGVWRVLRSWTPPSKLEA